MDQVHQFFSSYYYYQSCSILLFKFGTVQVVHTNTWNSNLHYLLGYLSVISCLQTPFLSSFWRQPSRKWCELLWRISIVDSSIHIWIKLDVIPGFYNPDLNMNHNEKQALPIKVLLEVTCIQFYNNCGCSSITRKCEIEFLWSIWTKIPIIPYFEEDKRL